MMMMLLIFQQCMKILTLPIHVLAYFGLWDPICKRIFPFLVKTASKSYNARMHKEKETLFKHMRDFANASGKLHVLEIGVGPGTNFEFYPPNSRVTCVDYNPNFRNVLLESMAQNTHLQFENFVVGSAENIFSIPDGSVDVVVGTLVLCSVDNAQAVLKEVVRVLRPGGVYYFMEHVAADRSTWTYFWQQVCNPTWGHVGDGCSLLKESWKYIENTGFSKLNLQHIIGPLVIYVMRPHIYGYGVK
ncbi:methyltransferase-like protein 7A [Protobothrops mucrosquamatus]|uniref:methyltransferase-like protein 7A n=1 Tax=Protobothrops mucrosquamatus TaxID=103944 RepID=UPI0007759718|nr:methyltransferase-like protein 7A [Protobothrops mucrosquamatus]